MHMQTEQPYIDEDEDIRMDVSLFDGLSLLCTAWVAVQKPPCLLSIRLCQPIFDQLHNHLIGYQLAPVHVPLGPLTIFAAGLNLCT